MNDFVIEGVAYKRFMDKYRAGEYQAQRLGQAFYNEFNLHKLSNQEVLQGLYEKDGKDALCTINRVFSFH